MADDKTTQPQGDMPEEQNPFDTFLDHQREALSEAGKAIESLLPPAFREHSTNAVNETVEGFKVLYQAVKDTVPMPHKSEEPAEGSTTGKTKVKVEVA